MPALPRAASAILGAALFLTVALPDAAAQSTQAEPASSSPGFQEEYKVYTESPRLFLRAQRLRLIRRERERDSIRWRQFNLLMAGKARMAEPGFASALYFRAGGDASHARDAGAWAASAAGTDVRQLALVFDWCQEQLTPAQKSAVIGKLWRAAASSGVSVAEVHARVLSAIALADAAPNVTESVLRQVVKDWWRGRIAPALKSGGGSAVMRREDTHLLLELLHAIRDNTNIELRDDARKWFKDLPTRHLLSHYPAPLSAPENEYRVPVFAGPGEPDVKGAALSRAAELMMVAYDANALESQFLQGWLIQDRFLLRGTFGISYEFLWANPYQPGLSVFKLDPFFHDEAGGTFFVRSSWEEDGEWFGMFDGKMQLFQNGEVKTLPKDALSKPLRLGQATMLSARDGMRFEVDEEEKCRYFLVGLERNATYDIEVDDRELYEARSDGGGVLALTFGEGTKAGVRLKRSGAAENANAGAASSANPAR